MNDNYSLYEGPPKNNWPDWRDLLIMLALGVVLWWFFKISF